IDDLPKHENLQNETVADQLLKLQWNLKESHVLTVNLLHNSEYLGNTGLSILRPLETTTNTLRRGRTLSLSDRRVAGGTLLETIFQWTRSHHSDLAKGDAPLEARPDRWRGNFFTDRAGSGERLHVAQTVAWERSAGKRKPLLQHRYTTIYEGGVALAAAAPTAVRVSPELRNPSGLHWNLEWEDEWAPRWVSRINYVRKKGRDQVRLAAITKPNGFDMVFDN